MATHAHPRISLDPLVPEARRRMRRRRALIAAVVVFVSASSTAAVLETRSPGSAPSAGTRACGYVDLGIGWHAWASSSVSCNAARTLMHAYIARDPAPGMFRGYSCGPHRFATGFGDRCTRGGASVVAIANH